MNIMTNEAIKKLESILGEKDAKEFAKMGFSNQAMLLVALGMRIHLNISREHALIILKLLQSISRKDSEGVEMLCFALLEGFNGSDLAEELKLAKAIKEQKGGN